MRKLLLVSLAVMLAAPLSALAGTHWRPASNGYIPNRAIPAGNDINGEPLFICRGSVGGSLTPGKIRPTFNGCHIAFNNQEMVVPSYEVLVETGNGGWR